MNIKFFKNIFKQILPIFFVISLFIFSSSKVLAQKESSIYLFYGTGCPHCSQVDEFFTENDFYQKYQIEKKEIYFDRENALLFNQLLDLKQIPDNKRGVPLLLIGDKVFVGDTPIINNFQIEADKLSTISANTNDQNIIPPSENDQSLTLTTVAVISASIVDAVNPCAFAVLIILMTTILASKDHKKALKSGIAFASSIFISYFLMGLGLYKALEVGGLSRIFFSIIGWLAIILGLFNLKDYFWYGKGFLMEVPMSWRPKMKGLINSVTNPIGAFSVGFLVSLFLLPCTSGPYIVILGMLAQKTTQMKAVLYLILYNLIFVSPMIAISWLVYKGFDPKKAENIRQGQLKNLHLIAGIIMILMGIFVLNDWI